MPARRATYVIMMVPVIIVPGSGSNSNMMHNTVKRLSTDNNVNIPASALNFAAPMAYYGHFECGQNVYALPATAMPIVSPQMIPSGSLSGMAGAMINYHGAVPGFYYHMPPQLVFGISAGGLQANLQVQQLTSDVRSGMATVAPDCASGSGSVGGGVRSHAASPHSKSTRPVNAPPSHGGGAIGIGIGGVGAIDTETAVMIPAGAGVIPFASVTAHGVSWPPKMRQTPAVDTLVNTLLALREVVSEGGAAASAGVGQDSLPAVSAIKSPLCAASGELRTATTIAEDTSAVTSSDTAQTGHPRSTIRGDAAVAEHEAGASAARVGEPSKDAIAGGRSAVCSKQKLVVRPEVASEWAPGARDGSSRCADVLIALGALSATYKTAASASDSASKLPVFSASAKRSRPTRQAATKTKPLVRQRVKRPRCESVRPGSDKTRRLPMSSV